MSLYRMSSRLPRTLLAHRLNSWVFCNRPQNNPLLIPSNRFHSLLESQNKLVAGQMSPLHILGFNSSAFQKIGFSSSTPSETTEKENSDSVKEGNSTKNIGATAEATGDAQAADQKNSSSSRGQQALNQKELPDSDSSSSSEEEEELTMEDLIKLVNDKEELLKVKQKEFKEMQDKVIRAYADMENARDRTRREAENSKKFAIQSFAKGLLDVADNLGRASSVVKESFSKIDMSKDSAGAAPLLKTLLEGVEMTEKQLTEVFKKFGVEKYDPTNEQFDPNRHNAVFQVPDASKPPGTVAVVLKSGYVLHDRVIRPAEVGVTESTEAVENKETDQGSKE